MNRHRFYLNIGLCPPDGRTGFVVGLVAVMLLAIGFAQLSVRAEEEPDQTIFIKHGLCLFSGEETEIQVMLSESTPQSWTFYWHLSGVHRSLRSGTMSYSFTTNRVVKFKFTAPETKEGLVFSALLSVKLTDYNSDKKLSYEEFPIWVFPRNPFYNEQEWLKSFNITLFDPLESTAEKLSELNVQFTQISNADALSDVSNSTVLIGSGVSFDDYRGLPILLFDLASKGETVICLAPASGRFPLSDAGMPEPDYICVSKDGIIRTFDKRFDNKIWADDEVIQTVGMKLISSKGRMFAEIEEGEGWGWLEMRLGKGRVILCNFAIIEKWDKGPVPRFLLREILEYTQTAEGIIKSMLP